MPVAMVTSFLISAFVFSSAAYNLSNLSSLPVLQLGSDSIAAGDHVRLLGVTLSSYLSLDRHVSTVSASDFYWLYASFGALGAHWTQNQRPHLFTLSCRHASTTAALSWRVRRK